MDLIALVARCCRGEEAAWASFLSRFEEIGRRTLRTFRLSEADCQDVLADALTSLYRGGLRNFRGQTPGELVSFVRQVVRNEAIDLIKTQSATKRLSGGERPEWQDSFADPDAPGTRLEDEECLEFLRQEAERLTRSDRELLLMKLRAMKEREIAEQTGRPPGTISAQISRLFSRLRQRLADRGCLK